MSLLAQIAIFLAATVIAIPVFRHFKLGAVLGYLAAGIIIGPACFGLIRRIDTTLHIAEFGIVLLMFVIGLELQPSRLWVLRKPIFGLGSAQVAFTSIGIGAVAHFGFGETWQSSLVIGFGLSMSSTALALQLLAERGQLNSQYGRSAFSILLFQDIAVMPALALMPLLAVAATRPSAPSGLWLVLKLAGVLATVVVGGRYVLRPMLRIVAQTRVTEAFTAAGLLVVIGTALLVSQVGLSMSLGAFLAGVLLADSEFRHELEANIEPFKGLLLGLFFITVGMSANLSVVRQKPLLILGLTLGFMFLKVGILWAIGRARHSATASHGLAFSLPSGGEFAFVLFGLAASLGIMDTETAELLVLVVTASMILSPVFLILHDALFNLSEPDDRPFDTPVELYPKVIIAGFGRFGQIVGRILRAKKIAFTALEVSQTQVDFLRRFGNQIFYGDASRLELLRAAHAENAEVFVLAIDDVEASVRTAELIRQHFPHLKVFARARNRQHAFRLMDLGVQYNIRETLASSLEMSVEVLQALGLSKLNALETAQRFRTHDEAALLQQYALKDDEKKLIQSGRESAEQLLHLFETDRDQPEEKSARTGT
jgi:glutathione-regulated potassium-efflux system ancillary protein KefC/glutathione-regulated potassium-efflux system protein KefB